jgi:hypothetical protein
MLILVRTTTRTLVLIAVILAVTTFLIFLLRKLRSRKTVYIIGAGLSKSVEKDGFPIPLMGDFVSVAAFYAAKDDVLLTTLAQLEVAGVFKNSDTNSRLLAERVSDPPKATTPDREDFLRIMREERNENIEELLLRAKELSKQPTHVGEPIAVRIAREELPKRFRFAINRVFYLVGWNVNLDQLRKFIGGASGTSSLHDLLTNPVVPSDSRTS